MNVHSPSVSLKVGWHFGVRAAVSDVANFGLSGVYCSIELIDAVPGLSKTLVGDGGAPSDCRDEAVCDSPCCVGEVIVLHAEEGLS